MESLAVRLGPLDGEDRRRGRPGDAYGALVRSIVGQQLSVKAARTIYIRLADVFGGRLPLPAELETTPDHVLLATGLSRMKLSYLRDLARHILSGELNLDDLSRLPDEAVVDRLTAVKGLGQWTAEMFLIFHLQRPDVLPVGDLGIRRAASVIYGLPELPEPAQLSAIAEKWHPHRSLACLYLWNSLDARPA